MPVKPENKARYPKDWPTIAEEVKAAAGWRCEQCGAEHGEIVERGLDAGIKVFRRAGMSAYCPSINAETGEPIQGTGIDTFEPIRATRIIITVAHLDHQPENVERNNLRALCQRCQRCHLAYDSRHHAVNAAKTRHRGRAARDFFEESP